MDAIQHFIGDRKVYVLDFETYWDSDFSLSKLPTPVYIDDPRFEAQLLCIYDGKDTQLLEQPTRSDIVKAIPDIDRAVLVAHHAPFDGGVLAFRYGLTPARWIDTKLLVGLVLGMWTRSSLHQASRFVGLKGKLDEGAALQDTKGKHWSDMSKDERDHMGAYCIQDTWMTWMLLHKLLQEYPRKPTFNQFMMMDWTVRMASEPKFWLDGAALVLRYNELSKCRRDLVKSVKSIGLNATVMGSNKQFRQWLLDNGLPEDQLPTKTSRATGRTTDAFSKSDLNFLALAKSANSALAQGVKARLLFKSDFERKRTEAYLNYVNHTNLPWGVGITYFGAHTTGRMSGNAYGGGNPQNLTRGSELRGCITAPPDYRILAGDSKQLELRVGLFMAGEIDAHDLLARGEDLYQKTADAYGVSRFAGKTIELQLIYGSGASKLQQQLNLNSEETWDFNRVHDLVRAYRDERTGVVRSWQQFGLFVYQTTQLVALNNLRYGLWFDWRGNDLYVSLVNHAQDPLIRNILIYPDLRSDDEGQWSYKYQDQRRKMYPAKMWQNFIQALSYRIIEQQALTMPIRPQTMSHDELVYVVHTDHVCPMLKQLEAALGTTPKAFDGLVLEGEVGFAQNYKDAKS